MGIVSGFLAEPTNLFEGADLRGLWACVAVTSFVISSAASIPALLWPRRGKLHGLGPLLARSFLGFVGAVFLGLGLFFATSFVHDSADRAQVAAWANAADSMLAAMLVIGPALVAATFAYDVALARRVARERASGGAQVFAVVAGVLAFLHAGLALLFAFV
ncbi:MAG: hypothetical protein U0230_10640 [Polyangiales bacterium]